jgi:hypothetical protein
MHVAWFHRCAFLRAACAGTYLASVINFNQRIGAMAKSNLAVIVGSNRRDSINRKLAHALAKLGAGSFDANFPRIDDLPMFNQDLEGNLPAEVVRYKNELARADAVLIVTPEHDRSIPALLKNAVDWGARPYGKNSWVASPPSSPAPRPERSAARWRSIICARSWSGLVQHSLAAKPTSLSNRT